MATRQLAPGRMPWRGLFVSSISTQCGSSSDLFDVSALLRLGGAKAALDYLDSRQGRDGFLDSSTLARLLLDCGRSSALAEGRRVHEYVVRSRFVRDAFLGNHLVHMYLKCQSFDEAERVFQSAACESFDVATWTAVIVARAGLGKWKLVFGQLDEMDRRGIPPDRVMIKTLLTACTKLGALEEGKHIQDRLAGTELELDIGVLNLTINMYVKCGCLDGAVQTFARMTRRDVVSWTVMIGAYSQDGKFSLSIQLFREMLLEGTAPNSVTFVSILSGCEAPSLLEQGRQIHALVVESSLKSHVVVANSLLGMYSRCRSWEDSRSLFDRMSIRDFSWSTIIMAYKEFTRVAMTDNWNSTFF